MLRHILLFRFYDSVGDEARVEAVERLEALGSECPTVSSWSIGVNIADSPSAYDVAEVAEFADEAALIAYKEHPAHREFSSFMGKIATWTLIDYEFSP